MIQIYLDLANARNERIKESFKESQRLREELSAIPQTEAKRVQQRAWSLTPAECIWHAVTWRRARKLNNQSLDRLTNNGFRAGYCFFGECEIAVGDHLGQIVRQASTAKSTGVRQGVSKSEFDAWWRENFFWTGANYRLGYQICHELLTQETIDIVVVFIIGLALAVRESKAHVPVRPPKIDLKTLLSAIATIRNSPISSALLPGIEDVLAPYRDAPSDEVIIERSTASAFAGNDPFRFLAALSLLDGFPATKPTKHVQSFFICVLAQHFRRTGGKPKFRMVAKSITLCFGEEVSAKASGQRCREFTSLFPQWPKIAGILIRSAKKKNLLGAPFPSK